MPIQLTATGAFSIADMDAAGVGRSRENINGEIKTTYVAQGVVNTPLGPQQVTVEISEAKYNKVIKKVARALLKAAAGQNPGTTHDETGTDAD